MKKQQLCVVVQILSSAEQEVGGGKGTVFEPAGLSGVPGFGDPPPAVLAPNAGYCCVGCFFLGTTPSTRFLRE